MTKRQVERLVRDWQSRLKLDHWQITVDLDKAAGEGCVAECDRADSYDTATIRFAPGFSDWSRHYTEQAVVHELLHLYERDLHEAVKSVESLLGKPAYQQFSDRLLHEREGIVDRLATVIVGLVSVDVELS